MLKVAAQTAASLFCPVPTICLPSIYPLYTFCLPSVFYSRENVRSPESPEGLSLAVCQTRSQSLFFSHTH